MANEREITIVIRADGTSAIAGMRQVGDATGDLGQKGVSVTESLKQNWLAFTAGVMAAGLALQRVFAYMEVAAEHAERMEALDAMTSRFGTTAEGLIGTISEYSHGLIGVGAAAQVAADALAKGFTPNQVAQMANIATTMHKVSAEGMTASEAFKSLEGSITAARERGVIKLMGATIDLSSSIGKQYDSMSKAQKATELLTAAGEQAAKVQRVLGDDFSSTADKIRRFKNQIEELELAVGGFFIRAASGILGVFQTISVTVTSIVGEIFKIFAASSWITDKLHITTGAAQGWSEMAEQARLSAENLAKRATANYDLALKGNQIAKKTGTGEALGGDTGNNLKRQEALTAIMRKYAEERDLIDAAEKDKELVRLNFWFDEQTKKLKELGAGHAEFSALAGLYAEKRHDAIAAWATKTSEFYLEVQRAEAKEADEIEKDRNAALFLEREQGVKERMAIADTYAKAGDTETESDAIRRRAEGEREILGIRQEGLVASITEQTTWQETLKIMWQVRDVENQIESSKRLQVADLDARRLAIEREITNLILQQRDLKKAAADREGSALASGSPMGAGLATLFSIDVQTDPYRQDFDRWSVIQDQKILAMEEEDRNKQQRLREQGMAEAEIVAQTESQKAEIADAYRQYDVQSDYMIQQQKGAQAMAYRSIAMNTANALLTFSGGNAKAQFVIAKGVAVAMAIVQAHMAAIGAAAALAPIPIVGPALAAAAYAQWMTIGYINAGLIAATAIGQMAMGGGGSTSAGSIGGGGAGIALPESPAPAPAPQETIISPTVQIHIYGNVVDQDKFARELVPAITKAIADGVV